MELNRADTPLESFFNVMISSVVPRPIAWVSTVNAEGQPNLAPFSFFNLVCEKPPTLLFCPSVRGTDGGVKDTYSNVAANGEFVVNLVSEALAQAMNETATEYPPEVNEFERAGLTAAESRVVTPPRVEESPVSIECKVTEILTLGDGDLGSGWVVLGEAHYLHVADDILGDDFRVDLDAFKPIGRLSGRYYARVGDRFEMQRGKSQLRTE